MVITRLGKGVDATGQLDPDAIERTLAVLREYRAAMDEQGVERVRIAATSAARDASNSEDFFGPAEADRGHPARAAERRGGGPAQLRRRHRRPRPEPTDRSS